MNIGYVGDSWTHGWGIENRKDTWPFIVSSYFSSEPIVRGGHGYRNEDILRETIELIDSNIQLDLLIIGWSGVSRIENFSLSYSPEEDTQERKKWFDSHTVEDLLSRWSNQIKIVNNKTSVKNLPIIHFSVFGDKLQNSVDNFLENSFLEYLATSQKSNLSYNIPIFEFDFLHEKNIVAENFLSKSLDDTWKLACAEREDLRPSKFFLPCGHPNKDGHNVWANNIIKYIT